ncbi:hypothetical protein N7532_007515 [Penicillium argentinense]|uniref:Lipase B n=1 Tax=Penicillium argentinense TaxID=1131581 RepID=A0A9W9F831_9EURO|nr:uncharacterized protein N7532_007515 [Penicillium argentinense]KAJ5095224.1 hypothetical protein N7532_007515 [Penicillium argentinense]
MGNPVPINPSLQPRDSPGTLVMLEDSIEGLVTFGKGVSQEITALESALEEVREGKIKPVATLEEALSSLAKFPKKDQHNIIAIATDLVLRGLAPQNILDIIAGLTDADINSIHNSNPAEPEQPIFPKKAIEDAPYSQSEDQLRSAIYIPEEFEYGGTNKTPVLLVPGTADPAGTTFYFSYEKLFRDNEIADPVWVNIPGNSLGDIQVNAEYVAYAINYISSISLNSQIGVLSWSQGSLDIQWALKYWPSTRESVSDFMALSADFHGTLNEELCLLPNPLCTPSIKQQGYNSNFIQALRSEDGDSAYVPTTSVYSGIDEVVEPQQDPRASAHLLDTREVGVSNVQIQLACPGLPAGSYYLHETMLVNPLAYALFVDALTHDGPGRLSRVGLDTVCNQLVAPGLGLTDLLGTEAMALIYGSMDTLTYGSFGDGEPPVKKYVYGSV